MEIIKEFNNFSVKHLGVNDELLHSYQSFQSSIPYVTNSVTPNVVEERQLNVAMLSVFDRLMMDRIIWCAGPVNDRMAIVVQAQLLFLSQQDPKKTITLHVDTPGGSVSSGLSIIDVMNYIPNPIQTINTGMAASMGSVLLGAGTKGMRSSLPFSRVMIHQVSSGTRGHVADNRINHLESEKYNYVLFNMLAEYCGKSFDEVISTAHRDKWFNAEEILKFGLIDEVLYSDNKVKNGMDKYLTGFDKYYQKIIKG
jgi:ATP-dependent Clp protease protease subunit